MRASAETRDGLVFVYHERQQGNLCGLHAVNNLLQGAYVTRKDCVCFARALDRQEKSLIQHRRRNRLLHAVTFGKCGWKIESDGNMSEHGDFSVQVLDLALRRFGVTLTPPDCLEDEEEVWGYLVNSGTHWFAYRWLSDQELWVNLDSKLSRPKLRRAKVEASSLQSRSSKSSTRIVFCVTGKVPPMPQESAQNIVPLALPQKSRRPPDDSVGSDSPEADVSL